MSSTYTPNLRFTLQGDNDNPNTWGQIANNQVFKLIDDAISGVATIDVTGTSDVNIASSAVNGGADNVRMATLKITGTIGGNISLIVPSLQKQYLLDGQYASASGSNYTLTVKPSGASSGVTLNIGETVVVYTNGTNIVKATPVIPAPVALSTILQAVYPIGSTYINTSDSTNPATLFGFGTWVATGQGRVLLGVGTGTDANSVSQTFAIAATGGEYQHTMTLSELVAHTHKTQGRSRSFGGGSGSAFFTPDSGTTAGADTTSTGSGTPFNVQQPYLVVYMWTRTQ